MCSNSGHSSNDDDNNSIDSRASTPSSTLGVKEHTFNQVFTSHSVSDAIPHFSIFIFFILLTWNYFSNSSHAHKKTQKEVFDNVAAPLVEGLFSNNIKTTKRKESLPGSPMKNKIRLQINNNVKEEGRSALLFAYGCTNAGKMHVIIGN